MRSSILDSTCPCSESIFPTSCTNLLQWCLTSICIHIGFCFRAQDRQYPSLCQHTYDYHVYQLGPYPYHLHASWHVKRTHTRTQHDTVHPRDRNQTHYPLEGVVQLDSRTESFSTSYCQDFPTLSSFQCPQKRNESGPFLPCCGQTSPILHHYPHQRISEHQREMQYWLIHPDRIQTRSWLRGIALPRPRVLHRRVHLVSFCPR
mmetsp:Transcript_17865/g.26113  ORF Transcript_17865/g.26113 Transcript_17865/m.26113 type:complete len:204 (+) Transcript_17865:113-724(+)